VTRLKTLGRIDGFVTAWLISGAQCVEARLRPPSMLIPLNDEQITQIQTHTDLVHSCGPMAGQEQEC